MFCLFKECKKDKFGQKPKGCQKGEPRLDKAEEIAEHYNQLKECCKILSTVEIPVDSLLIEYSKGWRIWEHTIAQAGIDVEEVYSYIKLLAHKRKAELEANLGKVEG